MNETHWRRLGEWSDRFATAYFVFFDAACFCAFMGRSVFLFSPSSASGDFDLAAYKSAAKTLSTAPTADERS